MSVDSRGVRRGQCKQCSCSSYVSTDGLLCRNCRHPPTKHDNMSVIPVTTSRPTTNNTAGFTSSSATHANPIIHSGFNPQANYWTQSQPTYDASTSSYTSYTGYQSDQPKCKNCSMFVHHDDKFGYFDYCSPKCRDEHFLPNYNLKLDEDIKNYHELMSTSSVTSRLSKTTSSKTASPKNNGSRSISTRTITLVLKPKEQLGLVLANDGQRIVVVGATTPNSIRLLCDCTVYLLDCIQSVNDQRVFSHSNEVTEYCNPRTRLSISLDHSQAIKDYVALFFQEVNENINKIFCLKCFQDNYGFKINRSLEVIHVSSGSDALKYGLVKGDKIILYTMASNGRIHDEVNNKPNYDTFKKDVRTASKNERNYLIIGVYGIGTFV